jgi:YfiH family protein
LIGIGGAHTLHGAPPTHLTVDALTALGLPHAMTTRHCPGITAPGAGASPVTPAAADVLSRHELDVRRLAFARQVHGARVAHAAGPGPAGEGDVIVSRLPGLPVAVFTADCLPIVLFDPGHRVLVLVHAGWRGTVKGVARAAVEAFIAAGGDAGGAAAGIGPSIGPCCYEVDRVVIEALIGAFPWAERWISRVGAGSSPRVPGPAADPSERWMLDLWGVNETQLVEAGVMPSSIVNLRLCTGCRPDLLYSHRRGARGRLVTLAAVPADDPGRPALGLEDGIAPARDPRR